VLADQATVWHSVSIAGWYGTPERRLEICSQTAAWFYSGLPPVPLRWVLLRNPLVEFDQRALFCTDPDRASLQIIRWFVRRWPLKVTFREARDHLGVETQRQWSDRAIARTTPCLLGLFSLVALLGSRLSTHTKRAVAAAAWYHKTQPTFADTLAAVRKEIWAAQGFSMSSTRSDSRKLPSPGQTHDRILFSNGPGFWPS
jgi:hypothetical protein